MKKYTIEEIRRWIKSKIGELTNFTELMDFCDEGEIDAANGYTPDTHVESENKFVNQQVPTGPNIGFIDSQYTEELMKDGPDPDNDSIY